MNGMVLSLNEVPDIARALKLSNPDRINWTPFASKSKLNGTKQRLQI